MSPIALVNDFRVALDAPDQLSLVFQPRFALGTGLCVGAEALLRWRHPVLGTVSPADFVPTIEQTALITLLTDWLLVHAMAHLSSWCAEGLALRVSVHAPAASLDAPDFAARVVSQLHGAAMQPQALELRFTQRSVAHDSVRVIRQLAQLKAHGVEIAIDDFGTGHSNLAGLHSLPATALKIGRTFVQDIRRSPRDRTLANTLVKLARDLDYRVIAEGIESREVHDLLQDWHCDEGQGVLMGHPMPAAELCRLLASRRPWWEGRAHRSCGPLHGQASRAGQAITPAGMSRGSS